MALAELDFKAHKAKRDKIVKRLGSLESPFDGSLDELENQFNVKFDKFVSSLGTVGQGNHFVEIKSIESIENQVLFNELGVDKNNLFVMAHSGSRGLGENILRKYVAKYKSSGLKEGSEDFNNYFEEHNYALTWAKANRQVLLNKVSEALGASHKKSLRYPS